MSGLTTAEAWAQARENLCHICLQETDYTCEGCGQTTCLECSAIDGINPDKPWVCHDCLEGAS